MTNTPNYNLSIAEGTDTVNLLTQCYPNFDTIDTAMKANKDASVSTAVETKLGTNHAIVRSNPDSAMFRFTAVSNYVAGDTFTVDAQVVTATTPDGKSLVDGCFVINKSVLCCLDGTVLTLYVTGDISGTAADSAKLGGELPSYYAKQSDIDDVEDDITTIEGDITNLQTSVAKLANIITAANLSGTTDSSGNLDVTAAIKPYITNGYIPLWIKDNGGNARRGGNIWYYPAEDKYFLTMVSAGGSQGVYSVDCYVYLLKITDLM